MSKSRSKPISYGCCVRLSHSRAALSLFLRPLLWPSCRNQVSCSEKCPTFWNYLFASLWYHLTDFSTSYICYEWTLTLEAWLCSSSMFLKLVLQEHVRMYCELPITSYEEAHNVWLLYSWYSKSIREFTWWQPHPSTLRLAFQLMVSTTDNLCLNQLLQGFQIKKIITIIF